MGLEVNSKIKKITLSYFGNQLIETDLIETKEDELKLPSSFSFNHSWTLIHNCSNCNNQVLVFMDFENQKSNFKIISNINSKRFQKELIEKICAIYNNLYTVEIEDITYLNSHNFKYEFDFQRKSSINLTQYSCKQCNSIYLGLIKIGSPQMPEKNLIDGKIGIVLIDEIYEINVELENFLK